MLVEKVTKIKVHETLHGRRVAPSHMERKHTTLHAGVRKEDVGSSSVPPHSPNIW